MVEVVRCCLGACSAVAKLPGCKCVSELVEPAARCQEPGVERAFPRLCNCLLCVHIENPLFSELRIAYSVLRKGRRDSHVSIALSARKVSVSNGIHINHRDEFKCPLVGVILLIKTGCPRWLRPRACFGGTQTSFCATGIIPYSLLGALDWRSALADQESVVDSIRTPKGGVHGPAFSLAVGAYFFLSTVLLHQFRAEHE